MPIYGYVCKSCDHRFDVLQKMSDDPLVHCPDCGKPSLQKELSAPKFRLKGSGWYETDFKKDNKRNVHSGDGDSKETKDTKDTRESKTGESTKKPDAAPAAKADGA